MGYMRIEYEWAGQTYKKIVEDDDRNNALAKFSGAHPFASVRGIEEVQWEHEKGWQPVVK